MAANIEDAEKKLASTAANINDSFKALDAALLTTEQLISKVFDPNGKLAAFERSFLEGVEGIEGILKKRIKGIADRERARLEGTDIGPEQIDQRIDLLNAFLDGRVETVLVKANEDIKKANEEIKKMAENFSSSVSKAFSDMVLKGELSARKIGNAFLAAALEVVSQNFIQKPLESFFGSLFGSLFPRAGGGAVHAGVPVLVGERAPEIFVPRVPGSILNSNDTRRALTGGGPTVSIVQNNSFTTDVRNSVRAEVLNALPAATDIAAQKVVAMLGGIRF